MHALLTALGTDGDVFPFVGLGARLVARGHRATLIAAEPYRSLAANRGLNFEALVSAEEMHALLGHPHFWHPIRGALVAARWGSGRVERQYALLAGLAKDPDAVLVSNPGVFAARLVQETLGRPLVTLLLQPGLVPSISAPPVLPWGVSLPRWAPRPLGRLYWRLFNGAGDMLVGRALNRVRAALSLRPMRRVFEWWLSDQLVLGLFPDWFGPPQPDWPPQMRLTGFPLDDGLAGAEVPPDVLEFCRAGDPPVAFTFGTGMLHAAGHFRMAVEVCERLALRGLLLTKHTDLLPPQLPPHVRSCSFAPFGQLFPQCAAVVHHGGIGTLARALSAGTPQLILPFSFDQPDNGTRVRRLGVGDWVRARRQSAPRIAAALAPLLTPKTRARCREVGGWIQDDGLNAAADAVEEFGVTSQFSRLAGSQVEHGDPGSAL